MSVLISLLVARAALGGAAHALAQDSANAPAPDSAAPLPGTARASAEADAPSVVRSARLVVEVPPEGMDVEVRIDYTVLAGEERAGPLRLEVLGFGPTSVETVRVEPLRMEADAGAVRLIPESGSMRAGELRLPTVASGADAVAFSFVYRVAGAVERSGADVRVRVPVVVLDLPPEQGGSPVFHASVRLPEEWSVSGGFPTGLAPTPEGPWEVNLRVVPALVSLRGRSDGTRRLGLPETLDALALIIILGFGLVGWRHLRAAARAGGSASPGTARSPDRTGPPGGPELHP